MSCAIVRRSSVSLALFTQLLLANSAAAVVTQTFGFNSAVKAYDRHASFDSIRSGLELFGYTENGLRIDGHGPAYYEGSHYKASSEQTKISTADGQKLVALEFVTGFAHSEIPSHNIVYWEAHDEGATVGSGIFVAPAHSIVGFVNPAGFDDLQIMSYFYRRDAEAVAAVGFEHAPQFFRGLEIDSLLAEVAIDSDVDGRLGRFDNCPVISNPGQADADLDGEGDACDEFPSGGSALESALDMCRGDLDALSNDPRLTDSDGDGEPDASDACGGTPAIIAVDQLGCSLPQFCAGFDPLALRGRKTCELADWRNDEPLLRQGDCRVRRGRCIAR